MAKKSDNLMWFRVYATGREALEEIPDANLGAALKAAMRYFASDGKDTSIENEITDKLTLIAFKMLKSGVDDSFAAHEVFRASGKKGAEKRKEKAAAEKAALEKYGNQEPTPDRVARWNN